MSLNNLNIFSKQSPQEMQILCCSHLSPSSLGRLGSTSKDLYKTVQNDNLWKQYCKQLYTKLDDSIFDKMDVKEMFLSEMKQLLEEADKVMRLIDNDTIASLICQTTSLDKLKTMPRIDRSLLVLSGINNKPRQLFTKIAMIFGDYLKEQLNNLETLATKLPVRLDDKLLDTKAYQLLHHLIETKRGPYKSKTANRFMRDTAFLMSEYHNRLANLQQQNTVLKMFPKLSISDR